MKSQKEKDLITKETCISNWNIPLFINYPYKDIISFIRKEFYKKDNDLLLLIRLYQEICLMQKDDPQKGFNIFLSEDTDEKVTSEEILYLVQNIKRLLYYYSDEIKQKNNSDENMNTNIYNSFINENPLLVFVKRNFYLFISIFKSGGFNEKNKTKDEKELDLKFKATFGIDNDISKFLEDTNKKNESCNKMDIEDEEETIDVNKIRDNNADNIKIEIINIYNFLLTTYNDLDKPDEDIIIFSQIIVKYLIINLSIEKNSELLNKLKKSFSVLIGLYIKTYKEEEKTIHHPIAVIFQQVLNYLIKSILYTDVNENNKKEMANYYKTVLSIYNILLNQKNKNLLIDLQNIILYYSKQLIYENVDSSQFRSPLEIKSINGLYGIDKKIIFHPYLFNMLSLLDEENANSFLGFYIRFFYISEKNKLFCCKENIIKCLEYLINIKWFSKEYNTLIKIINDKNTDFDKLKKINEFIYLYLRTNKLSKDNHLKEKDSNKKAVEKLEYLYKNIILENINVLN